MKCSSARNSTDLDFLLIRVPAGLSTRGNKLYMYWYRHIEGAWPCSKRSVFVILTKIHSSTRVCLQAAGVFPTRSTVPNGAPVARSVGRWGDLFCRCSCSLNLFTDKPTGASNQHHAATTHIHGHAYKQSCTCKVYVYLYLRAELFV